MIEYVVALVLIIAIGASVCLINEKLKRDRRLTIPFKESMDLLSMPIITFENNGNKLHFLLDTGSNNSLIDADCLENLEIIAKRNIQEVMVTAGNSVPLMGEIIMDISYLEIPFKEKFTVTSLSKQFDEAFEGKIKVHGIIGSKFLRRNKCILDFEKLAVYYNTKK